MDACADQHTTAYLNLPAVQRALHVRASQWKGPWEACSQALNDAYSCPDTLVSVVPLYRVLLERGFRVLVYSGDVDGVVPTRASTRWINSMGGSKTLLESWRKWEDEDGQIGGVEDALGCSSTAWGAGVRDSARSGSPGADVSAASGVCVVFEVFGEGCMENVKSTIP